MNNEQRSKEMLSFKRIFFANSIKLLLPYEIDIIQVGTYILKI